MHELPDNWVVWTEEVQSRRSEEKLRGRPSLEQSTLQERLDTNQAKRYITGLPATTTGRGTTAICLWKRSSTYGSAPRRAFCRLLWSPRGHETDQTRGLPMCLFQRRRGNWSQQLTELKTQQRAQQPMSKRLESATSALPRAQRRAVEARAAFTLAQSVKEQADQEAAKIQSELCVLEEEAHRAATESTTHPIHRCSDIIDSTISALHQARVPTEQLDQARLAALTLINGLHGLCSAAGTVTGEAEDQLLDFGGSHEEFKQMLKSIEEEFARSVRRRMTYKRPHTVKELPTSMLPEDSALVGQGKSCEQHGLRGWCSPRSMSTHSKQKTTYHAVTNTESTQTIPSTRLTEN